jgi:hypothetical protein
MRRYAARFGWVALYGFVTYLALISALGIFVR